MIKTKLKAIKRADEKRIIDASGELYGRLVEENGLSAVSSSPEAARSARPTRFRTAVISAAAACLALVVAVGAGFVLMRPYRNLQTLKNTLVGTLSGNGIGVRSVSQITDRSFSVDVDTVYNLKITVVIEGEGPFEAGGDWQKTTVEGVPVTYSVSTTAMEDCYIFDARAVAETENGRYFVEYGYSSTNPDCELLSVMQTLILAGARA